MTTMNFQDFTATFTVDQRPEEVFAAINDVRGWWSGDVEGSTDAVGDVWTYRYKDIHYSKQRITELVPGERVAWHVLDGIPRLHRGQDGVDGHGYRLRHH